MFDTHEEPTGKVQLDTELRQLGRQGAFGLQLNERICRAAQREYDQQFPGQPYERMQERGGMSVLEMLMLLTERVERLEKDNDLEQER